MKIFIKNLENIKHEKAAPDECRGSFFISYISLQKNVVLQRLEKAKK